DMVAHQVLKELDAHRAEMRKEPKKIRKLVDDLLLPHFDTEYSARQVLGLHWRTATPDQRTRFIEAFYQSLLQNYGEALVDFTPDRLKMYPYKPDPSDPKNATVRTEIRRDNGTYVPVSYTLHKTDSGWKAWDVKIEGISYVKSFRTDFATEIDQKGLDAVITRLEAQQANGKTAGAKGSDKK
ncbi:MAG TPA: ABC transporter substrate-binding protein, partial [Steroidobacteraceae bacterium]|nr:ABC transporter substrate-binding protein [Steroidobacteraceae bacterium]